MALTAYLLILILATFRIVLIVRVVLSLIMAFSPDWRPTGFMLIVVEVVYTVTDPPLKALRKVIRPIQLGQIRLDLAFIVLFVLLTIAIQLLSAV